MEFLAWLPILWIALNVAATIVMLQIFGRREKPPRFPWWFVPAGGVLIIIGHELVDIYRDVRSVRAQRRHNFH